MDDCGYSDQPTTCRRVALLQVAKHLVSKRFALLRPDFTGSVPGDMTEIKLRTKIGVTAVRILANGAADLPKAVEVQKGFHMMPLSAYLRSGLAYKPPEPRLLMPLYESKAPEEIRFFDELGDAFRKRLPASADASDSLVASFSQIGLTVGKGFEWQTLDEPTKRGLTRAAKAGPQIIDATWAAAGGTTNGWKYTFGGGRAGSDPALRAALVKYELGAQLQDQVLYPNTTVDDKGEQLTGHAATSCISMLANCRQSRPSGTCRCTEATCCSWKTTLVVTAWAARQTD